MSEEPKPLGGWVLLAELLGATAFGLVLTAYYASIPSSVNLGMSLPAAVASRIAFFALVVGAFNLAVLEGRRGHRIRSMILLAAAVCLVPILLLLSFPQY